MIEFWNNAKIKMTKIMEKNIEYNIFPLHFFLLNLCAMWYPKTASSFVKFIFQNLFRIFLYLQISLNIAMGVYAFQSMEVIDILFCCTTCSAIYKIIRLVQKRDAIISLIEEYVNDDLTKVKDEKEEYISRKINIEIRYEKLLPL